MTTGEYVEDVAGRLEMNGFNVKDRDLSTEFSLVGYRSQFRLQWLAKMNLFAAIAEADVATASALERCTKHALDYGVAQKGRFRGLQNGVAVISILVANSAEPEAIAFAQSNLTRRFGAFAWPVLVDLSTGTRYQHEGKVMIGGLFANWMREQIDNALPGLPRAVS